MINFSVKPSSYTGASDTNGGGYVDGYDATYANFCTANGGPLYTNIEPTTYGYDSTGLYDITHSMTVPTGVICYCRYADDSASTTLYFYAYLVNADNWQMVYLPVGGTGISSQAVIDDAISNAEAGDELLLLAVGGALATIEAGANLAKADGHTVLIEGPATYVRTAGITDIVNLIVMGVDASGDVAEGDDRPHEDLHANAIQYGYTHASSVASTISHVSIKQKVYSVSGTTTAVIKRNDDTDNTTNSINIYAYSTSENSSWYNYGLDGYSRDFGYTINSKVDGFYGFYFGCDYRVGVSIVSSLISCYTVYTGIYNAPPSVICSNSIIICKYFNMRDQDIRISNCIFMAKYTSSIAFNYSSGSTNIKCLNVIFFGFSQIFANNSTKYNNMINCAWYNTTIGGTNNYTYQNNIALSADPFVDYANGDYRLNPDGPDFARLFNVNTGQVLIGATGPEQTNGGAGSGVCNLIGNGGMIE